MKALEGVFYLRKKGFPVFVWTSSGLSSKSDLSQTWGGFADGLISWQNYTCQGLNSLFDDVLPVDYQYSNEVERFACFQQAARSAMWLGSDHFSELFDDPHLLGTLKTPELLSRPAVLVDDHHYDWDPRCPEPIVLNQNNANDNSFRTSPDENLLFCRVRSRNNPSHHPERLFFDLKMAKMIARFYDNQSSK